MPIDPFAALTALVRAEATRTTTPAEATTTPEEPERTDTDAPGTDRAPDTHGTPRR